MSHLASQIPLPVVFLMIIALICMVVYANIFKSKFQPHEPKMYTIIGSGIVILFIGVLFSKFNWSDIGFMVCAIIGVIVSICGCVYGSNAKSKR